MIGLHLLVALPAAILLLVAIWIFAHPPRGAPRMAQLLALYLGLLAIAFLSSRSGVLVETAKQQANVEAFSVLLALMSAIPLFFLALPSQGGAYTMSGLILALGFLPGLGGPALVLARYLGLTVLPLLAAFCMLQTFHRTHDQRLGRVCSAFVPYAFHQALATAQTIAPGPPLAISFGTAAILVALLYAALAGASAAVHDLGRLSTLVVIAGMAITLLQGMHPALTVLWESLMRLLVAIGLLAAASPLPPLPSRRGVAA